MIHAAKRAIALGSLIVLAFAFAFVVSAPAHAVITNCLGQAPTIKGDGGDNIITGTRLSDVIFAGAGNDTVNGGGGNDIICGGIGDDHIDGGAGNDTLVGDDGADALTGNTGIDTINYSSDTLGVNVDLGLGEGRSQSGVDSLNTVENVDGSPLADLLAGDAGDNGLRGLGGNDSLQGGLGNDVLDGGTDVDTATFNALTAAVTADLSTGTSVGQGSDNLLGIENLTGTVSGDHLTGDAGPNTLVGVEGAADVILGGDGDDLIYFEAGVGSTLKGEKGNDYVLLPAFDNHPDGGPGSDTIDFSGFSGVEVNLISAKAIGEDGSMVMTNFENVVGTSSDDRIIGDAKVNSLDGVDGNDVISGFDGADHLIGGLGDDTLDGGDGDDKFDGGAGKDTAAFAVEDLEPVSANLANGTATGQGVDSLKKMENLFGSGKGDVLVGDAKKNVINGAAGVDTCDGNGGNDTLIGCP